MCVLAVVVSVSVTVVFVVVVVARQHVEKIFSFELEFFGFGKKENFPIPFFVADLF